MSTTPNPSASSSAFNIAGLLGELLAHAAGMAAASTLSELVHTSVDGVLGWVRRHPIQAAALAVTVVVLPALLADQDDEDADPSPATP